MNYCTINQWVLDETTGRVGLVSAILKRRTDTPGQVIVRFGAGGPFDKMSMEDLRETSGNEYKEKVGLI